MTMRVLVCGGRDYFDRRCVYDVLGRMHAATPIVCLIAGGANGADALAIDWAAMAQVPRRVFKADWDADGKAAGPIRNQRMLDEGKPDLVVAFPGGKGTEDMVRRAMLAEVKIIRVTAGGYTAEIQ